MLVECLRCAIHDRAPGAWIDSADWAVLLRQARGHSVECFLFPWLRESLPAQFSAAATVARDSPQAAWRALALEHLTATLLRQRQTQAILKAFAANRIDTVPLKGSWLSETVYPEPSRRQMVDIDLLVKRTDTERAHIILQDLGYAPRRVLQDNEYMCDLPYYHPDFKAFVELHWNVESLMGGAIAIPEIERILARASESRLLEQPVRVFPAEDQLCHLVQHILHHQFALSLRSYVDIALLIKAEGEQISGDKLAVASGEWKTGRAVPFMLRMTASLFDMPMPPELMAHGVGDATMRNALATLFDLPVSTTRRHERNLLRYSEATFAGKIRLVLSRIFMPPAFMRMHYPFTRNRLLLPAGWVLRAADLVNASGKELLATRKAGNTLSNAATRRKIVSELTETTSRQES